MLMSCNIAHRALLNFPRLSQETATRWVKSATNYLQWLFNVVSDAADASIAATVLNLFRSFSFDSERMLPP